MRRALGLGTTLLVAAMVAWLMMDAPDAPQAPTEPPSPAPAAPPRASPSEGPVPAPVERTRTPRSAAATDDEAQPATTAAPPTPHDPPGPEAAGAQAAADTGPTITVWPATAEGIQGAVREAVPRMKPCYEDALRVRPDLAGKLVAEVQIVGADGLGVIDQLDLVDNTVDDLPLEDCMLDVLADLQFDPPAGGGTMRFTYPFVFQAE